ncbi:MAG TPA: hypothetical protein VGN74_11930 [Brevundimonas sp.]|jgi:hypothetical protein|uniref:hypothetical protein n=1 Tax=Brevundimonas sp. TaxID=1871086 RepID=UPI002E10853B|nr:hypothetical protein [Brevundimonas sp.]
MLAPLFALALIQTAAPEATPLPAWALTNPFGYERAQCSPLVRGEEALEACQGRVRRQLAEALGEDLPPALRPATVENCRPADAGGGVICGPERRSARADAPVLVEQECSNRPTPEGFSSECRPVNQRESRGGLSLRLGRRDD